MQTGRQFTSENKPGQLPGPLHIDPPVVIGRHLDLIEAERREDLLSRYIFHPVNLFTSLNSKGPNQYLFVPRKAPVSACETAPASTFQRGIKAAVTIFFLSRLLTFQLLRIFFQRCM